MVVTDEVNVSDPMCCETEFVNSHEPQSFAEIPGPNNISQTIDDKPFQPKLKNFTRVNYGTGRTKGTRSLQSNWYDHCSVGTIQVD